MDYLEEPNEKEKQWLERISWKTRSWQNDTKANLKRLSISREHKKVKKEVRDNAENDSKFVEGFKWHVC